LHHFILCLRRQLQGSQIKVVEIPPPAVQTELPDEKHQSDIKNGRLTNSDEAYRGLVEGLDQIPVGMSKIFDTFETKRQEIFNSF
jgi:short-subunit dehydrogenase involved in D-alanine esterification of teichoic acids